MDEEDLCYQCNRPNDDPTNLYCTRCQGHQSIPYVPPAIHETRDREQVDRFGNILLEGYSDA